MATTCCRCKTVDRRSFLELVTEEGWVGMETAPICPGCQLASWHPHCLNYVDGDFCDFIDTSLAFYDEDPTPWVSDWVCPKCGGVKFDFAHADFQPSEIKGTSFRADRPDGDVD